MIELRSDTLTLPTAEMLKEIQKAPLGDDGYGEDPTVNKLQKIAAKKLGKEAAILMPSGIMANLATLIAQCPRGSKIIVGDESDIYIYEAGGASVCGGLVYEPVKTQSDGRLLIEDIKKALPEDFDDPQFALPGVICLENTHNRMGGIPLSIDYLKEINSFSRKWKIPIHIDGARIFNASVAQNITVSEIAKYADTVMFCLSKGLSSPVGSMVAGRRDFIEKVHRIRKMLGGAMRQAGIIAAPGIIALRDVEKRLPIDHENAKILAKELSKIKGIEIDVNNIHTNIVIFRVRDNRFTTDNFIKLLHKKGVNVLEFGHGRIRAVTHSGVKREDMFKAAKIISSLLEKR